MLNSKHLVISTCLTINPIARLSVFFILSIVLVFNIDAQIELYNNHQTTAIKEINDLSKNIALKPILLTVFVHGIISVKPHLSVGNVIKLMRDKIADSSYARTVEIIRKDPFFYQHHPMQELGLKEIDMDLVKPGAASSAFAQAFDIISSYNKESVAEGKYYTFGWSGLLSPQMRYLEAEIFYKELEKLVCLFRNKGFLPKIRIVGYSHGGNVALKLASIHDGIHRNNAVKVDQLILVGVPILPESAMLISHSIFDKIYHFYSLGDRIQNLDCFALNRFFSERIVCASSPSIAKKLTQIRLIVKRPQKKYSYKNFSSDFLRYSQLRNADPGHSEFWSFGWTHSNYRKNFPLDPLPMGVFTPFIVNALEKYCINDRNLIVEIHPYNEKMLLKKTSNTVIVPFITHEQLNCLKNSIAPFKPLNYSAHDYNMRIKNAIQQGKKEKKQENEFRHQETRKERRLRKRRTSKILQDPK